MWVDFRIWHHCGLSSVLSIWRSTGNRVSHYDFYIKWDRPEGMGERGRTCSKAPRRASNPGRCDQDWALVVHSLPDEALALMHSHVQARRTSPFAVSGDGVVVGVLVFQLQRFWVRTPISCRLPVASLISKMSKPTPTTLTPAPVLTNM